MKKVNIKLMKRNPFAIGIYIFLLNFFIVLSIVTISAGKFLYPIIFICCIIIFYFICFITDIYGIRINEKYIILHAEGNRKKYLKKDIKSIEVWFVKMNKHYKIKIRVHLDSSYIKKDFIWDEIMFNKMGNVRTKINSKNINEYISLFDKIDKFYVHAIGK